MSKLADTETANSGATAHPPTGLEVVMIVAKDNAVRDRLRMVLSVNGYKVLDAADKLEALALCGEYQGPIDLLLSVEEMPELKVRAPKLRPSVKVLFMNSDSNNDLVARTVRETLDTKVATS